METKIREITAEIGKVIIGKDEVIEKVLTAILAGGHILLEDMPGVGKTTLALAFSKAMGMSFRRMQFTPDVVPSDIVGFTMYDRQKNEFTYCEGTVMCNFFLADEINRTSSKTQSALLEVMQEGKATVDGQEHILPQPFIVMATQNPIGTAGTQKLPEAQLDRFMIKLSMGYPDLNAQADILRDRGLTDPLDSVELKVTGEKVMEMKERAKKIYVDDKIYRYIAMLAEATRDNEYVKLGLSPRGALALCAMAKATAFVSGRDYVTPEDVNENFRPVCRHRLILMPKARMADIDEDKLCQMILNEIRAPKLDTENEEQI